MKLYQKVLWIIGLVIGVLLILQEIYEIKVTKITDAFGPRIMPAVLCVFIFGASSVLIICSKNSTVKTKSVLSESKRSLLYLGLVFIYILFMKYLGFLISSLLYVEISVLVLGGKRVSRKVYVYFSLIIVVMAVFLLFEFLKLDLPKGLIFNGSI